MKFLRRIFLILVYMLLSGFLFGDFAMKVLVVIDGKAFEAALQNNSAAADFYSMLPLELEFEDFASAEKIAFLKRKLNTKDSPDGYKGSAGDINYYAPWGNLAIFYKDSKFARGLVHLGSIDKGALEKLSKRDGKFKIKIEKFEK